MGDYRLIVEKIDGRDVKKEFSAVPPLHIASPNQLPETKVKFKEY